MASVSVYRCYAKCVFDIKILILPTQENGRLDYQPLFGKMSPGRIKTGPGRRRKSSLGKWVTVHASHWALQYQQQQQNFINKKIYLKKYCLQLTRLFDEGQCVQNIKIETKAINIIIIFSRGLIQLSG